MSKICRVCLVLVENAANSLRINTVEASTGFMPLRDKLALCVPEMVLDMIQDPVICTRCSLELQAAYEFKNKCLQTEEKIRRLIRSVGGVVDLTQIANSKESGRKGVVKEEAATTSTFSAVSPQKQQPIKMKKEADDLCEIEFHDISEKPEEIMVENVEEENIPAFELNTPNTINDDPLLNDGTGKPLQTIRTLKQVGTKQILVKVDGGAPLFGMIQCNFCEKSFSGLFYLRQHQRLCKEAEHKLKERAETESKIIQQCHQVPLPNLRRRRKAIITKIKLPPQQSEPATPAVESSPEVTPALEQTKKEPKKKRATTQRMNLPAKAKMILQKWLFQHRDNPYPTDVEKLHLIHLTKLTLVQVENWFINARRRILQRMLTNHTMPSNVIKFDDMKYEAATAVNSDEDETYMF